MSLFLLSLLASASFATDCVDIDDDGWCAIPESGIPAGETAADYDCDDQNSNINPGMPELCDSTDNDCNDIIDDPILGELPENFDNTIGYWHYIDLDADGYGDMTVDAGDQGQVFICNAYENYGDDATVCASMNAGEPATPGSHNHGHLIEGDCYVPNNQDCNDGNHLAHPYLPDDLADATAAMQAEVDAGDHGYDGTFTVDLDCDGTDETFILPAAPEDTYEPTEDSGDTAEDTGPHDEEPVELSCGGCSNANPAGALWLAPLALIGLRRRRDDRA